jgi:hypothetical protein
VIGWDLERFQRDLLLDSLQEASACYWERRAEQLAEALPRPTDRPGLRPTDTTGLYAAIQACRNKAAVLRMS